MGIWKIKMSGSSSKVPLILIFLPFIPESGDICTIKWMFGIPDVLDFLRSRKIKEGSTVQVIQRINGGLILGMDGKRIAMCDAAADRIQV